jgi:hypothetical protein
MRSALLCLLLAIPATAQAISRHDPPSVKAIVKNKKPGFKLRLVLRSEGLTHARIGLGRTKVSAPLRGDPGRVRALLEKLEPTFIAVKFDEMAGLAGAAEFEQDVIYGEGNDLQPGDEVDVWTAWRMERDARPTHFYGVFSGTGVTTLTLPGAEKK